MRQDIDWRFAIKRGVINAMPEGPRKALYERLERRKSQAPAPAIVEHPPHVIKNLFGYRKVRYRSWTKNAARDMVQAALAHPYITRRQLLARGVSAPAGAAIA